MEKFVSYVDGAFVSAAGEGQEVRSPSEFEDILGTWHAADAELAARAVASAHAAFPGWNALSMVERGDILYRASDALTAAAEDISRIASREMGKPIGEMRAEVQRGVALLRYYGGEGTRAIGEVLPSANPETLLFTLRRGVGPTLLITPWNFPVAIPIWKAAPALVFGNAIVWKPAAGSLATAAHLVEVLERAGFPKGVLNLVLGRGSTVGRILTRHPLVRAVSFTGSREAGMDVAQGAIEIGARVQLEMGGKNPAIVLEDADVSVAALRITSGALRSAGQKCTATSRVIAVQGVADRLREALRAQFAEVYQGPALDERSFLGPVSSPEQQEIVLGKIRQGIAEGARVLAGPDPRFGLPRGAYIAPTLLEQSSPQGVLHSEEIFGPVVGLFVARDAEQAIEYANAVPYGLSASLFTRDLDRALYYMRHMEAGLIRVNEESAGVEFQAPFGGVKDSSYGPREQGRAAIEFYTETRTVTVRPSH